MRSGGGGGGEGATSDLPLGKYYSTVILLGSTVPVSKFIRRSTQDEDIGVKYDFVDDGYTFSTEGATLK